MPVNVSLGHSFSETVYLGRIRTTEWRGQGVVQCQSRAVRIGNIRDGIKTRAVKEERHQPWVRDVNEAIGTTEVAHRISEVSDLCEVVMDVLVVDCVDGLRVPNVKVIHEDEVNGVDGRWDELWIVLEPRLPPRRRGRSRDRANGRAIGRGRPVEREGIKVHRHDVSNEIAIAIAPSPALGLCYVPPDGELFVSGVSEGQRIKPFALLTAVYTVHCTLPFTSAL